MRKLKFEKARDLLKIKLEASSALWFELSIFLTLVPVALPCDTLQKWRRCMIKVEAELPPTTQPCALVTGEKPERFLSSHTSVHRNTCCKERPLFSFVSQTGF